MSETLDIPPGTEIIDAIRAERSPFHSWAGEVLDNSLDASASIVHLIMNETQLSAQDNGSGITKDKDTATVKIGGHADLIGTKLGRFGIGIKYKSIQHGNVYKIHSVSKDGLLKRDVDWRQIRKSGRWVYPVARRWPLTDLPMGTTVTIEELFKKPTKADIARTKVEIQRRYYPALEQGISISLNGERVEPIIQPHLKNIVEATRLFADGRSARIRGGMLLDPASSKMRQVDMAVAFRVIKPESSFGCDGYGGVRSMFARIDLIGPWQLTKFKDDLADDPCEDELEAWAEDSLRPVLEQCASASMELNTNKLQELLNDMLPENYRPARPQQKQKLGRVGEKKQEKRDRDVDEADENPTGPVRNRKSTRGILIEFADGLNDEYGYGRAQTGKSNTRIQLANDNPHIVVLKNARDQQTALIGLYSIAALIFEGELMRSNPRLVDDPIGLRAWSLGKQQTITTQAA